MQYIYRWTFGHRARASRPTLETLRSDFGCWLNGHPIYQNKRLSFIHVSESGFALAALVNEYVINNISLTNSRIALIPIESFMCQICKRCTCYAMPQTEQMTKTSFEHRTNTSLGAQLFSNLVSILQNATAYIG